LPVIRVNKSKDYVTMSNYHFKEKDMSLKAKGLLSEMLSLPDNWDYSIRGLVAINKESESSIKNTLEELKKFGYLRITKLLPNQTKTGRIEYVYDIFEKKQEGKKQGVENLGVEFLEVENQVQYNINNKILNNKKLNNIYNNNIYNFIEENFGRTLNPLEYEEISTWEDNELTRYAIKEAILGGKYNIKYISVVLHSYKMNNIKTVQQAQEEKERFKNKGKKEEPIPSWFNQEIKEEDNLTDEEREWLQSIK
jgi:DnaD/phage-associated family protein